MSEFSELLLMEFKKNKETIFTSFSNTVIFVFFQTNVIHGAVDPVEEGVVDDHSLKKNSY